MQDAKALAEEVQARHAASLSREKAGLKQEAEAYVQQLQQDGRAAIAAATDAASK